MKKLFLFIFLLTVLARVVSSFDSKCSPLRLVNGRSRYSWRGRSVRFNCMRGFQLVGVKYATCMNGKWDADVPVCVKYGCRVPSATHVNGQFIESYRGAVVKIVCNPGYALVGPPSVYCNGLRWNKTFPVCRVNNSSPALSCDFESPDLCGWSQDPMHDFDWKRQMGSVDEAGPSSDHTRGGNATGHYMYVESSNRRMENDTARLYSPVYPPKYSNETCFQFFYYVYGEATGFLKVFVKPEGVELFNLIPSFWINGGQGKSWIQSFFQIEKMETNFQIVVEGVRGSGAAGDIAFDDVKITTAEECKTLQEMTSTTEISTSVNPDDDVIDLFSCKNRCEEEKSSGTGPTAEDDKCNCYETCDRDGTCCSDFFDVCSTFPSSTPATAETESNASSTTASPPAEAKPPSVKPYPQTTEKTSSKTTAKSSPSFDYNNESNEIPNEPILPAPPQEPPNRTINQIPRFVFPSAPPTTRKTTTEAKISEVKNEIIASTERKIPVVEKKKTGTNRTRSGNVGSNRGTKNGANRKEVEGKPETERSSTVTSSVSTTTAKALKYSKPNKTRFQKTLGKPSSPTLTNDFRFVKTKPKETAVGKEPPQAIKIDGIADNSGGAIRATIEIGGAIVGVLAVVVLAVFCYKRREYRKSERENMVEDSDSIVYDSTTLGSESHSLVCIRPGGLQQNH